MTMLRFVLPGRRAVAATALAVLVACGGGGGGGGGDVAPAPAPPPAPVGPVVGPAWPGFGRDAQHTAVGTVATQPLARIAWSTPVDLAPQRTADGALLTHYGSPVVTARNTVLVPVKTGATGPFRVEARAGADGALLWSLASDWRAPAHRWIPAFNVVLAGDRLALPMSGGRLLLRDAPDAAAGTTRSVAFYGDAAYAANPAAFDASVFVNTPITADSAGTLYFGYAVATGTTNPAGLVGGGIVRLAPDGTATRVEAATAAGDPATTRTALNAAPALSGDERTLYVVVKGAATSTAGRLLALDAATLAPRASRVLADPQTGTPATVSDDATASPAVGPDGDVLIGVLAASPLAHHARGWLLHFDATLATAKTPASFGWDLTPSVVPRAMLPAYTGPSSYLLALKFNDYIEAGGSGDNRVALVDPGASETDPLSGVTVMRVVQSLPGPTADPGGGVKEWCINTAAVDPATGSVLVNSEDGFLYRWHLPTNRFSERIGMNNGVAQSYTPTLVGPDGRVYSVNNATLFAVGR